MSPATDAPDSVSMTTYLHRRRWFDRRDGLDPVDASQRISAFLYGNILTLAALVAVLSEELSGHAVVIVIGTTISTFVAHVVAEGIGHDLPLSKWPHVMRESWPILTSGVAPALVLWSGLVGILPIGLVVIVAPLIPLIRLALTGVLVARLRGNESSVRIVLTGVGVAAIGLLVVLLKLVLTH